MTAERFRQLPDSWDGSNTKCYETPQKIISTEDTETYAEIGAFSMQYPAFLYQINTENGDTTFVDPQGR